jgi:phage baseplate assembly protein W
MANNIDKNMLIDLYFDGEFGVTNTGDIALNRGLSNLKQAIFHRLITAPGSLVHRPDYGIGIKLYQGKISSLGVQRDLAMRIKDQLELDPRVTEVTGVRFDVSENNSSEFIVVIRATVLGYDELNESFNPFEAQL